MTAKGRKSNKTKSRSTRAAPKAPRKRKQKPARSPTIGDGIGQVTGVATAASDMLPSDREPGWQGSGGPEQDVPRSVTMLATPEAQLSPPQAEKMADLSSPTMNELMELKRSGSQEDEVEEQAGYGDSASTQLLIGDDASVESFYTMRLQEIQQLQCKAIAKDWIKAVEPKKQAKYPYNGGKAARISGPGPSDVSPGELKRPPWWPPSGCPHREPDHIKKDGENCIHLSSPSMFPSV